MLDERRLPQLRRPIRSASAHVTVAFLETEVKRLKRIETQAADEIERLLAALQRIADEDDGIMGGIAWAALQHER